MLVDCLSDCPDIEVRPAIQRCLRLLLTELDRFISDNNDRYPTSRDTFALGLCTGSFAAAAFTVAKSATELIQAGTEAVLVALRVALRSYQTRNDIVNVPSGVQQSWSVIVNSAEKDVPALLDTYATKQVRVIRLHSRVLTLTPACRTSLPTLDPS